MENSIPNPPVKLVFVCIAIFVIAIAVYLYWFFTTKVDYSGQIDTIQPRCGQYVTSGLCINDRLNKAEDRIAELEHKISELEHQS